MKAKEKINYISNWIGEYVKKMPVSAKSLVIGVSGGIDSSVSSTLSAMTGMRTIVLCMPIKQHKSQHDLSIKHKDWLIKNFNNVEGHVIELDELFKSFENNLSKNVISLRSPLKIYSFFVLSFRLQSSTTLSSAFIELFSKESITYTR